MRDGWKDTILSEVLTVSRERVDPSRLEPDYELIHWSIPQLDETGGPRTETASQIGSHKFAVLKDSVVYSLLNPRIPRFAKIKGGSEVVCSTEFAVLQPVSSLNIDYLYCFVSSPNFQEQVRSLAKGTTKSRERIDNKEIDKLDFKLPPLPEQKRIVDLISSVDTYIDALKQQLESAKKSRNAVLHELLTAGGDDWVERKLPEVVEVLDRMRKPINGTEREERKGTVPYYGANGQTGWIDEFIFNEELVLLGEDAIDFADPSARKAYLIQGPSWVNNHAHVLRADKIVINSYFLMESLNKVDYSKYVSFGTRSKLTQASMNGIKVLVPSMKIQEKVVDLLTTFDEVIEATQCSIEDSKVLRSGMLSDLLNGEHEIPATYDKVMGAA